jgi:3-hydroxymyristoyl/3-hydroxydecanoyl-(acyl carrier protein) dehydratase
MTAGQGAPGSSVVAVDVLDERSAGSSLVRVLRVREDVASLAGHFPGHPVVPAVVQIQWAMDAAERLAGPVPALRRLEALKFKAIIRPGQLVEVAVELSAAGDAVQFRIGCGDRVFSSGRCVLRQPVPLAP